MLIYMASPYTRAPGGLERAFINASKMAASLLKVGVPVFSPIAHSHAISVLGGIDPKDHTFWMKHCRAVMQQCEAMAYCLSPGHENSTGMAMELKYFRDAGKPVFFWSGLANEVPMNLVSFAG